MSRGSSSCISMRATWCATGSSRRSWRLTGGTRRTSPRPQAMSDDDKPSVIISDRQEVPADHDALADLARSTLTQEGAGPVELSVSLVNTEEMAQLHVQYA